MERDDDPGPDRNCFADSNHRLFSGEHQTVDKENNRAVGLSHYVPKSARLDGLGSVLCRMGVFLPQPSIFLPVL